MRHVFYYKLRQEVMTKCGKVFSTKWDSFITKYDSYYKMWQLLQNAMFITKCVGTDATKVDVSARLSVYKKSKKYIYS